MIDRKYIKGKPKYLIRWKRYIVEMDTQEDVENLRDTKKS